jgi:autotransporter-associated beta strand protein
MKITIHYYTKNHLHFFLSFFLLILIGSVPISGMAQSVSFSTGANMLTPASYSSGVLPTNANDVLLATSNNSLVVSTADLTMRSLNVTNDSSYIISNNVAGTHTLNIGNPVSFTNAFGSPNDIFYLNNNSSLTIQPTSGTKILGIALANNGNVDVTTGSTLTISSIITDSSKGYAITKTGGGTLALSGVNTYTGIIINGGIVSTTNGTTNFGTTPGAPVSNYITINGGAIQAAASFTTSINRGFTLGTSGGTFDNNGFIITNDAAIAGTGSLTLIGAGTFNYNSAVAATYTGNTFVQQGTLKNGLNNGLPATTTIYLGQTLTSKLGTYDLNNKTQTVAGVNSVTGTNASTLVSNTVTNSGGTINILTIGGSGNYSFGNGTVTNSGIVTGSISLNMAGTGTQILGGINTFIGTTTFNSGELRFTMPTGSAQNFSAASLAGGTFSTVGSGAGSSITFSLFGMTASSTINLENTTAHTVTFTTVGAITGSTMLTINGWQGTNGSAGTMGRIFIGNSAILTPAQLAQIQFVVGSNTYAAIQLATGEIVPYLFAQETDFYQNTNMFVPINYTLDAIPISGNDILLTTPSSTLNLSTGNITAQSLNVTNGKTYIIGDSSATNRVFTIGNPTAFTNIISGAANDLFYLNNNSSVTIQPAVSGGTAALGLALASSGNFDITVGSTLAISSIISGSNGITKNGGGKLALSGINGFTGPTTINAGVVSVSNGASNFGTAPSLFTTNQITLNGGTIQANGPAINLNSTRGISLGASGGTFDNNGQTITLTSLVSGTGSLTKIGAGMLTVICSTGGNGATYTGNTFIQQDILQNGNAGGALPAGTIVYLGQPSGTNVGTLDLNAKSLTIAGINSVTGSGAIAKNKITNNATGVAPTLKIGGSGNYSYGDGTTINSGVITGTVGITMQGTGLQILGDINSYSGITTCSSGELRFVMPSGSAQTLGALTFNGGTLSTVGSAASTSLIFTSLTLSSSSSINLDSTVAHTLLIDTTSGGFASGQVLTISGWQGAYNGTAGTKGRIFIGNGTPLLVTAKISQIQFSNGGVIYGATQLSTGEIVPNSVLTILTGVISGSPFCAGTSSVTVNFSYTPTINFIGNSFTAQLSSGTGSFASPVNLQSILSNGSGSQSISVTIPGTSTAASKYRIRVVSTTGVIGGNNGANLTIAPDTWLGGSTNWNTASNWCSNNVPDINTNVQIPVTANSPNLTGTVYVNNITINTGASVTVVSGGTLSVHGTIANSGVLDVTAGTLQMAGSVAQTLDGSMFNTSTINNLADSNTNASGLSLTSGDPLSITGHLSFVYTTTKLTTNNGLVLISNATTTASVGAIAEDGSGNAQASIVGNVTVQRYYQAHRRWRFITAPVQSSGAPTINAAWQEGGQSIAGSASNPSPGFGTDISGPGGAFVQSTGYDQSANNSASIAKLTTANSWFSIPSTFVSVKTYQGYMLFVRGDRSFPIYTGTSLTPATSATIRTTGALNTGRVTVPVNSGFTVVGNPYAATINFNNVYGHAATAGAVTGNSFSIWDPNIGSSANVASGTGGWVTLSWNATTSTYDASPNPQLFDGFDVNGDIQSGAAFAVNGTGSGSVEIDEADKNPGTDNHLYLFRPAANTALQYYPPIQILLRTTLYATDTAHVKTYLADGVLNEFDSSYRDTLNRSQDISKLFSFNEKVAILNYNTYLSIERSPLAENNDTIHLSVSSLKQSQPYQFEIQTKNFTRPDLNAFLVDSFRHSSTSILLGDTLVNINFTITSDPLSYVSNRFCIVFKSVPGSVKFDTIAATPQNKTITVQWVVNKQLDIKEYVVEKSIDNINFYPVDTTIANDDTSSVYNWIDDNAVVGNNYYRIRSIDNAGVFQYSGTVDVMIQNPPLQVVQVSNKRINIYPNPVTNGIVQLYINDLPGKYDIKIFEEGGSEVLNEVINQTTAAETHIISLNNSLAKGEYMLRIVCPDGKVEHINFEIL